ncbi:hypothetical protein Efla_001200 [Eimeria flavescens]
MVLLTRVPLLAAVAGALSSQAAEIRAGEAHTQEDTSPEVDMAGYQNELKVYLPSSSLTLPKGLDIMEPPRAETQKACGDLKAFGCEGIFTKIDCEAVDLQALRQTLVRADMRVGEAQHATPNCVKALKKGLILYDLVAVATPFTVFQTSKTKDAYSSLEALFKALRIEIPKVKVESEGQSEGDSKVETQFLEMNILRRGRKKVPQDLAEELSHVGGTVSKALVTHPNSYLAFAGTGGPLASFIINWLYQVFARFEEFFKGSQTSRRPLAPLVSLLTEGHQLRILHLYRMCGVVLGGRRTTPKLPANSLFVPMELFTRRSNLVGLPRLSCDVMTQSLLALHMAEINAIERLNAVKDRLPPTQLERAVPLELSAGGVTNLQRLCLGFRAQHQEDMFKSLSCSLGDTLLASLEAKAEGEITRSSESSFVEAASAQEGPAAKENEQTASQNAHLTFSLLELRAGNRKAAAKLLNTDAGSSLKICLKALKGSEEEAANYATESLLCSEKWQKKVWERRLRCPAKLVKLQCGATEGIYNIFEGGMSGSIESFLGYLAKRTACGSEEARCSESLMAKQSPFKVIANDAGMFNKGIQYTPGAENMLRIFLLLSGNSWKKAKDLMMGADGVDVMLRNFSALAGERKTSTLLSRWLPRTLVKLVKRRLGKKYSKRHLHTLISKLPANFFMQLRTCIEVVVHPLAFLQLNQLSFTRSEPDGERSSAGGLSQKLDSMLGEAATKGFPQRLKEKLQAGETVTTKDYRGINFALVEAPKARTWQEYLKMETLDHLSSWLQYPENRERLQYECSGGMPSNLFAVVRDSMELLSSAEAENLILIGKVVSPKETSLGEPKLFKRVLSKVLRLPPFKAQHHSFVGVKIDIPEAIKAIRALVSIYTQHKVLFDNQHVFVNAVLDLFAHYERKYDSPSRKLLGVPENALVPVLNPLYASMPTSDRLRELKDSALAQFFRHIWTLMFSVSANAMLNAAHVDGLEKTFTQEAWSKSINDPFQASSFGMILMGSDIGLQLFNQLLPGDQRKMLMRSKYGSAAVFTSQTQLTGSLLSASGHPGLGTFLHAQAVYFGVMIRRWIGKRASDRVREILSWLSLGLFFASSFIQAMDGISEMASTGNQTGQASMGSSCPPMGVCLSNSGDAFVADPTGSPALTALQVILKTGIMASFATFAGPVVAVYNIAVSNFEILSRLEMAVGNAVKRILTRLAKSKAVKNIKKLFKTREDVENEKKLAKLTASSKSQSLGDDVETSVSSFFQFQRPTWCKRI